MTLNFNEASAGLPMGAAFEALDEGQQQLIVRRLVERLVEQTEARNSEPDDYEQLHLGKAALMVNSALWRSAVASSQIACVAPVDRIPVQDSGIIDVPKNMTLRELLSRAP